MTTQQPSDVPYDPTKPATFPEHAARSHGNPAVVSDPGSELVDPDPAHDTPATPSPVTGNAGTPEHVMDVVMSYAGANAGGQSLNICMGLHGCGALVMNDQTQRHIEWHQSGRA